MPSRVRGFALALALAMLVVSATPTFAAKGHGGGGGTSTLTLVLLNSTDGTPHWGQNVTFSVSTTATSRPYVNLDCTQNGALVYSGQAGYFPDYPWVNDFILRSSYWTGGDADCTARLTYFNGKSWSTLSSISFHVYA